MLYGSPPSQVENAADLASLFAAAVKASARPPTCSIRSPSVYDGHGVGLLSSSSPTRATIDTVRVGKFEATNVECLVMPESFSKAPPLLGGAFINRFNYKMDPDTGKLTLSKLGGEEEPKSTKKTTSKKPGKKS